jgi:hypothetical protein
MQHSNAASAIIAGLRSVTKDWARQRKAEERDRSRRANRYYALVRQRESSVKELAYEVMEEAYMKTSANDTLLALARQVFYRARPLVQKKTDKPLDDQYFTQTLLPDYMREHKVNWKIVYDERGHFIEPHTRESIGLGTIAVRDYLRMMGEPRFADAAFLPACVKTFGPKARFAAVLFIEKEGFFPLFEQVKLAERYDLAFMSTKGMSNTAARELIDEMCGLNGIPALVLHDFDKSGMSILGTLQNDNRRYEFKHSPRIIDLGLRLEDVGDLESESYDPGGGVDDNLRSNGATEEEIKFLKHRRVELNAFASDEFVSFIERKLDKNGIKKVVPDRNILAKAYRLFVESSRVEKIVKAELAKVSHDSVAVPKDLEKRVRRMLAKFPAIPWDIAVRRTVQVLSGVDEQAQPAAGNAG